MTSKISNIKNIYLFGLRGYKTNSYRSDIDLLIEFDGVTPIKELKIFLIDYLPLDIFINRRTAATSFVNDSEILLRDNLYPDLFIQLDAIKLWDKLKGFELAKEEYFVQETVLNVDFAPSCFEGIGSAGIIEDFIYREPDITDIQKRDLLEAVKCYNHKCYLGFVSMMGTFYEDLLFCLADKYFHRVGTRFPSLFVGYNSIFDEGVGEKKG